MDKLAAKWIMFPLGFLPSKVLDINSVIYIFLMNIWRSKIQEGHQLLH